MGVITISGKNFSKSFRNAKFTMEHLLEHHPQGTGNHTQTLNVWHRHLADKNHGRCMYIYIYVDLGYFQYIKTRGKILEKGSKYTRWAPSSVNGVMGPFAKFFLLTMVKNHHLFFHLFVRPDSRGERVIPLLHPGRFTNGT